MASRTLIDLLNRRALLRNTAEASGGGAPAGDDTAPAGAGADTSAAATGDDTIAAPAGGASRWWEDRRFDEPSRRQLEALGLTVDDPLDAVARLAQMEAAAKKKLGKPADQLMDRPGKGEDLTEWMRRNGELFGIPEAPDKYEIGRPESWPKDAPWDSTLEASMREAGHKLGLSQAQVAGLTEVYAGRMAALIGETETGAGAAEQALRSELVKDWGDAYDAKVSQAQMAASAVAEAAKLDDKGLRAVSELLAKNTGDAQTIRLFAAIGEMMGEDSLKTGGGGNTLGSTPADARAELQAMQQADSDYMKAATLKRQGKASPEFERLHKRYLELNRLAAS